MANPTNDAVDARANGHANGHTNGSFNGLNDHANDHTNGSSNVANGHVNGHANDHTDGELQGIGGTPVAICGMAMRLPGGIRNDRDLYDLLYHKGDAQSVVPSDRYNIEGYYSADGRHGTINTKQGYFLRDIDYANIDLSMFTLSAAEAEQLDPNHRLVLEVVREAFENAGESEWRSKNIGTYSGLFTEDWQEMAHRDNQDYHAHRVLGGTDFALPNRVAYEYDLKGPSMVIKTACSSAGIALHEALEAIREEKITAAVITGSNLIMAPGLNISLTLLGSLSPEGSSKSFDASADGYARGEAVSAIYIKRLDEAIKDGNPIRAVIRASATNADGKSNGITMPEGEAHERLIRQAYSSIGLDMAGTAMIEAHGTGTKVGDPIEVGAIGRCWGENGIYIGASKPNLGHSEGAAALTGVMKAVVSLENRTILPNIKFDNPNPRIPWKDLKLTVPTRPTPWPEHKAERMSVNSYGIGGSNVHFVIDSAASFGIIPPSPKEFSADAPRKSLLLLSANHEESLKRLSESVKSYLGLHPDRVEDAAYTLASRREHMKLRSFVVWKGASPEGWEVAPKVKWPGPSKAAFIFTGQGAQWVHMGRELMVDYPSFLANIRSMDKALKSLRHAPSWSMEDALVHVDDKDVLLEPEFSQPLCTALQVALVDLLATWNIKPSAVVGHSSGELAAAYAAGALSAKEAVTTAFYRGQVCKNPKKSGGMAAVGLGRDGVYPYLAAGVCIACENSGSSVTISGEIEALEEVMTKIKEERPDVLCRKLQVKAAYHSHHMALVGGDYHDLIAEHLSPKTPKIPFYSSVRAKILRDGSDFGPRYWQDNLESPVLFHSATKLLLASSKDCAVHLEVGPHAALAGPLRQIYKEGSDSVNYVSVLSRGMDDTVSFLSAIGQLHSLGVAPTYPHGSEHVLTDLPNYPWHYEKTYWSESRIQKSWRFRKHLPHDLLGLRILEGSDVAPSWRNVLKTVDVPWLNEHCVGNDTVFPAAGYLAMAGEAVFQISGIREYTVREVEIKKALVLYNDKSVEIITNLAPQRLNSSSDSQWYTFQIVSYDGNTWNTHCSGLVRSGRAFPLPAKKNLSLDRVVSASRWYTTLSRVGLNYTGKFARLSNMAASVVEPFASAEVFDERDPHESSYAVHPSTLDMIFQSLTIAKARGIYRDFNTLFLPTYIEELYVGDATRNTVQINTSATGEAGIVQGHSYGLVNGDFVYALKGFQGTSIRNADTEPSLAHTTLELQWKPHPKYLETKSLMHMKKDIRDVIRVSERLEVLCAIETRNAIQGLTAAQPHLDKYRDWLNAEYERYQQPGYPLVEDSADLVKMDPIERRKLIEEVRKQAEDAGAWATANAIYRAYAHAAPVFEGKDNYLDILLQDGVLTGIYADYNDIWDFKDYLQLHGHANPQMRILEIGAGTGGLTSKFLENLRSDYGERLYLKYMFTDISSGFFVQAKERFKDYEGIEYQALDISKDPVAQGFNAGEYDLIIASNVLHATPILQDTLANVRTLLKPDGQLFMQELCPVTQTMQFVIGAFEGWWLQSDGRDTPFLEPAEWDKRLRDAGLSGCDSVIVDYEKPYTWVANIVAKPAIKESAPRKITLLQGIEKTDFVTKVEDVFRAQGIAFDSVQWGDDPPADQDIISFVDLGNRTLLQDISIEDLAKLSRLVDEFQGSTMLWLMPPAQIGSTDPYAGQMIGLLRTIRSELAASFATVELGDTGAGAAKAVADVLRAIQSTEDSDDNLDIDMEWAWLNSSLHVGRFHWIPIEKSLSATAKTPTSKALAIRTPGLLQSLEWVPQVLSEPAPEEVHIRVAAAGVSQHDVQTALGGTGGVFGLESVGRVTKLGANVGHLAVGDRVLAIGSESTGLATVITRPSQLVVKIPDQLSDEEAATLPLAYITASIFLVEKWKLEKGQTALIHNAASGTGIAAINMARWLGAEVYATAGTEEESSFLVNELGIPKDRIFSSLDSGFVDGILAATRGAGVDLVLNSLTGDLQAASWKTVADDGAMVDFGAVGMGRSQLPLAGGNNRTFLGGDVTHFLATNKPKVARLLNLILGLYVKGEVKPSSPVAVFDGADIEAAFRLVQQAESRVGSVAVKLSEEDALPLASTVPTPEFRGDATYVLVGGLGGLGKAIAQWMVQHGARSLMFLSRSAGKSQEDQDFFKELALMGCSAQYFAVDIADAAKLKEAVSQASKPIAGALHMPLVLADKGFFDMDHETWNKPITPKVTGAWNLHNFLPKDMDFLVLFSSVGGTYGYYGQSNYAAANTFLDSFSQYRRGLGLPASVMSIGPIDDVGLVARNTSTREALLHNLASLLTESYFLDTLQLGVARSQASYTPSGPFAGYVAPSHIFHSAESATPIEHPDSGIMWKRDPRMAIYRNIQRVPSAESTSTTSQLKQFLQTASKEPSKLDQKASVDFIANELGNCIANFLGSDDVDLSLPIAAAGVDSLVAIEIRNWWKTNLGTDISVLELLGGGSIEKLGAIAAQRLKAKYAKE
ncbi:putative polyketide synthase [Lojkania enalia]|uniref:Polyketide synthase n=1 Tax=Lojkania enalia TaxID=147567 RepID=A0A9P4MYV1_9PLEO|nr:putative polyketide synthase [Didymosphaeria enalia]